MPVPTPLRTPTRRVDAAALTRMHQRLDRLSEAPWLHREIARRMAERLPIVRLQPEVVVDWGAHAGGGADALRRAYPKARQVAVEFASSSPRLAEPAAGAAGRWGAWWPRRWAGRGKTTASAPEALADGVAQLVWSNMALHREADPPSVFARWHKVLRHDGFLMFSTLGPGSLQAMRDLYAAAGWGPAHAPFIDMHDLGDMLIDAGFADPVMDQETLTLTWSTPAEMLAELRQLGANADPARTPGLRTPRWRERLLAAFDARRGADQRVALGFEIVYGHAFRPLPRARVAAETVVPVDDLRTMARAPRRTSSREALR